MGGCKLRSIAHLRPMLRQGYGRCCCIVLGWFSCGDHHTDTRCCSILYKRPSAVIIMSKRLQIQTGLVPQLCGRFIFASSYCCPCCRVTAQRINNAQRHVACLRSQRHVACKVRACRMRSCVLACTESPAFYRARAYPKP